MKKPSNNLTDRNFAITMRGESRFRVQLVPGVKAPSYLQLIQYISEIQAQTIYPNSLSQIIGTTLLNENSPEMWNYYGYLIQQFRISYSEALVRFGKWLPVCDFSNIATFFNEGGFITGSGRIMSYNRDADQELFGSDGASPIQKRGLRTTRAVSSLELNHNSLLFVARPDWTLKTPSGLGGFLKAFAHHLDSEILSKRETSELDQYPMTFSVGADTMATILLSSAYKLVEAGAEINDMSLKSI